MNEQDTKILSEIQHTLSLDPNATQRTMAKNSNISLGMMNAVLKRCIERGWIAVKNLNMKKVCYCLTPEGFEEISNRSANYMKSSFSMMNDYAEKIQNVISQAKEDGKSKVVLIGKSNIQFVIEWACQKCGMEFEFCEENDKIEYVGNAGRNAFNLVGECQKEEKIKALLQRGWKSVCDVGM